MIKIIGKDFEKKLKKTKLLIKNAILIQKIYRGYVSRKNHKRIIEKTSENNKLLEIKIHKTLYNC